MKFYFKIYISYMFFFILNIIMFSFISISIYRLLCSDSYSIDFLFKDYSIYFFFFFFNYNFVFLLSMYNNTDYSFMSYYIFFNFFIVYNCIFDFFFFFLMILFFNFIFLQK